MSSAVYPLGMRTMPASGYTHKSTYYNKEYKPWKGTGVNSYPVGTASGHIRPLTNNDPGNVFQTGFGLPRPIKHFRKGRFIPPSPITGVPDLYVNSPYNDVELSIEENALINYNINRFVKSSKGTSLGGGSGGSGLLNEIQEKPGAHIVKLNTLNEIDGVEEMQKNCQTCEGTGIVINHQPNITNLIQTPEPVNENVRLCCNEERFAKQRVIYASTNLKKNYYTTTKEYLRNRCKTYDQKAFNFLAYKTNPYPITADGNNGPVPGSPLSMSNTYLANCQINNQLYENSEVAFIYKVLSIMVNKNIITQNEATDVEQSNIITIARFFDWIQALPENQRVEAMSNFTDLINNPYWGMPPSGPNNPIGCQLTVYKPNNYQFAKQGAVSSSTRLLKLNVDTISTNAASIQNYNNTGSQLITANEIYAGNYNAISNLFKNKAPSCNTQMPLNMKSIKNGNKKFCYFQKDLPSYQVPKSEPAPYRYYPGTVFSSNRYGQSPNNYKSTAGSAPYG